MTTDNFWGYIINGLATIIAYVVYGVPTHTQIGLVNTVAGMASTTIMVVFAICFSMINMTWPIITFTVFLTMEFIRVIYAGWRWIKRIVVD